MNKLKRLLVKAQLLILLSLGLSCTALASTPPGSRINNIAKVFYELSDVAEVIVSNSNAVTLIVGEMHSFAVENYHNLTVPAGDVVELPHRIVNQGNTKDNYSFQYPDLDPAFFAEPIVYHDKNSNGKVDPGEPELASIPALLSEQSIDVVVTTRLSAQLAAGLDKELTLVVTSENSGQIQIAGNSITVGEPGKLQISLSTFPGCTAPLFPGDVITHTVGFEKTAGGSINDATYLLDGELVKGVIVAVPVAGITDFFQFQSDANGSIAGTNVVKLEGALINEWISVDELTNTPTASAGADPAATADMTVRSTGYFIESENLDTEGAIARFSVQHTVLEASFSGNAILSTATFDADNDGLANVVSGSSCNTFSTSAAASGGQLLFVEPAAALRLAGAVPDFYRDADFVEAPSYELKRTEADPYLTIRDGMYLELRLDDVANGNIETDSDGNRYGVVTLTSQLTGDTVDITLLETAQAGVFRSVAPLELSTTRRSDGGSCPALSGTGPVVPQFDQANPTCVLQTGASDQLLSLFGDDELSFAVAGVIFIGRQATIFDAQTFIPIPGVGVEFRRADTNEVAINPLTNAPLQYITDAGGNLSIPRFEDDVEYYLHVNPVNGYQFPSSIPPYHLTEFNVHGVSYGRDGYSGTTPIGLQNDASSNGVFLGVVLNNEESIDIPLDGSDSEQMIVLDKVATQSIVDIGQSLSYLVTVKNVSTEAITEIVVTDTLPFGFRYVSDTAALNGSVTGDPTPSGDGDLLFDIGDLAASESRVLTYAVRATAAAVDSNGINTAIASGITAARTRSESLPSKAKVTLQRSGVFSSKAAVFGKIYVDQNCDGVQNHKEWPIAGVRLYLQDGTYVVSDADGQYSLYGLDPGNYVLKVDSYTLPEGLKLKLLSPDQGADASSRFVDLSEGDFHRTDFAAGCPAENGLQIFGELKHRNRTIDGSWRLAQAEKFTELSDTSQDNQNSLIRGSDGDLSNGILDGPKDANSSALRTAASESPDSDEQLIDVTETEKAQMPDAKVIVSDITAAQAKEGTWLWPTTDVSINGRFMVVVRDGLDPTLFINDTAVPTSHIGERIVNRREKAQVVAWYGVELDSGENKVEVKGKDSFGNDRVLAQGIFKRPSAGTRIELVAQHETVPADGGRSLLPVSVRILDDNDYPALGVYYITVESSEGSWAEPDIQDSEPGRQVRIENGERTLHFRPSSTTGDIYLTASTGEFSDEIAVQQIAETRPLIVSGLISANTYLNTDNIGDYSASVDLGELGDDRFKARAALFAKGTVKGDYNLTMSYDSDKARDQELLRDINPALHYPIHGDSSIRGFEAQSRSKLYIRVERDNDSVMYGDYLTDASSDSRDLARISRTLTGLNAIFDDTKNKIHVFAAREENTNLTEEIPGNGSALLYRLRRYPIVANSETVELITRSRDNEGLIIETTRLSRLGDYTLDDETGNLSFPSSIPTLDQDQNPVFIRVTYDIEGSGENYNVAGVRFNRQVSDNLSLGASATYDGHQTDGKMVIGAHGEYRLGSRTNLRVSVAKSDSDLSGSGNAHSIGVDHKFPFAKGATTTLTHAYADAEFNNPGASVAAGRSETTLQHTQQIKNNINLLLNASDSRSTVTDDNRSTYSALLESQYKEWQVRAGLRKISQSSSTEENDLVTSVLGLGRKFNLFGKSGQTDFEYEQDLGLASRKRLTVGGKLKLHEKVNAYSNYELTNSLLGLAGIGSDQTSEAFTAGVESKLMPSTKVYSEYRMRGAVESRDHESASGVRGDYEIEDGLKVSPHFEYIKRMGDAQDDSVSASVGLSDTRNPNSRRLLRLETRRANDSTYYGFRGSMTSRVNLDWTATITDNFTRQQPEDGNTVQRHTFVAAVARRPKYNNKHHMLFMYRLKQEQGVTEGVDRTAHVLSTHQNLELNSKTTLSGRFGFKQDTSSFDVSEVSDFAQLVDVRAIYEIDRRIDIEARAGILSTNGMSELRYSMGFGANYVINRNLRVNATYNFAGFREEDLDEQNYNASGFRFGLQYKLDEEQFKWLK